MQMNVMEQLLFLINDTVKQVPMDGDENGLQDAKTTLLTFNLVFSLNSHL